MKLCQVHLEGVPAEEREILSIFFFHPLDTLEEDDDKLIMNYGSGEVCLGTNEFGEGCKNCRHVPFIVRKILQRQTRFVFGKTT